MKATKATREAADFIEVTYNAEGGATYKCLKCGHTKEANAYYEADHKAMLIHAAQCGGNGNPQSGPTEEKTQSSITPQQNGQQFTEAPASFNVKAISPQGFDIMLTLRANDSGELLGRIEKALAWLITNKFTPTTARSSAANGPRAGSGNGSKYCSHKGDDPGFCPAHGKEMKKSQHHPGYYCPAKV